MAKTKKSSKSTKQSVDKVVEQQPVEVPETKVPEVETSEQTDSKHEEPMSVADQVTMLHERGQQLQDESKELYMKQKEYERKLRDYMKDTSKLMKYLVKHQKTKRPHNPDRKNGLQKKVKVSKELLDFFGLEADTLLSRVDVSNMIHQYIVKHKLQDTEDKRKIMCDKKLEKLLKVKETRYFNMQNVIKPLFV